MHILQSIFRLFWDTIRDWLADNAPRLAAALSFYTVLSIAPLLIILVAVVGSILGQESVQEYIVAQLQQITNPDIADTIARFISDLNFESSGVLPTIISLVFMFFAAGGMFGQLYEALNTIFKIPPHPNENDIIAFLRKRLVATVMILAGVLLLFTSMIVNVLATDFIQEIDSQIPQAQLAVLDYSPTFMLISVFTLFVLIFKFVPDARVSWRDVLIGAAFTTVLFGIGEYFIGLYLSTTSINSLYGAAGSVMVLLLWIYYTAQILLLGAKFTYVFAQKYGRKVEPSYKAARMQRTALQDE